MGAIFLGRRPRRRACDAEAATRFRSCRLLMSVMLQSEEAARHVLNLRVRFDDLTGLPSKSALAVVGIFDCPDQCLDGVMLVTRGWKSILDLVSELVNVHTRRVGRWKVCMHYNAVGIGSDWMSTIRDLRCKRYTEDGG